MRRLGYIENVTSADFPANDTSVIPLLSHQLEYFRRFQFDVQMSYYRTRQYEHERSANRTLEIAALAVFLGALATGLSGGLGFIQDNLVSIAAVGVVGVALASYALTRETITQDRRNADRYAGTYEALLLVGSRLDEVRTAVALGNRQALLRFVSATHEQLSVENRQWMDAAESTDSALASLDMALSDSRRSGA